MIKIKKVLVSLVLVLVTLSVYAQQTKTDSLAHAKSDTTLKAESLSVCFVKPDSVNSIVVFSVDSLKIIKE